MKILAKRFGNFISLLINNKPRTIEFDDLNEMNKTIDSISKASKGDQESIDKLTKLYGQNEQLTTIEKNVVEIDKKIDIVSNELKSYELDFSVLPTNIFDIVGDRVRLKDSSADMPKVLISEIINQLNNNESIDKYIKFWKLNLLNPDKQARRGLYEFIINQKLFLDDSGYFVAFRRIDEIKDNRITNILNFIEKIRKGKRGLKNYGLFKGNLDNSLVCLKLDDEKTKELDFVVNLFDFEKQNYKELMYTDNYSKKMNIIIGHSVKMSRDECDSRHTVSCSRGLHVGNARFVEHNYFGNTVIAVLCSPQHVVSVPYSEAEKMRVCQYLPFMKLNLHELTSFESINYQKYINKYIFDENEALDKALDVIDELTKDEFDNLVKKDSKKLVDRLNAINIEKDKILNDLNTLNNTLENDVYKTLDYDQIKEVIKARTM